MKLQTLLLMLMAMHLGLVVADETYETCANNIFGCSMCEKMQDNSQFVGSLYTCTKCDTSLYLKKFYNEVWRTTQNICVPNCQYSDEQTVNDEANMQCIYLGPFCGISSLTTNSATGLDTKKCSYSYMNDHGFKLGNRYRMMEWFHNETFINPNTSFVQSTNDLKILAQKYINPIDGNNLDVNPVEENVSVVAQCQNKYCNLCEDFNLTKCVTCWGRFGIDSRNGQCEERRTCNSLDDNDFKTGCFQTAADCFGCGICDLGFAKQTVGGSCYNCTLIHDKCEECSGQVADNTIRCDICEEGYGLEADNKTCFQCLLNHAKSCHKDALGNQVIDLCEDGFILSSDGKECLKTCNFNEFPEIVFDPIHNTESSIYCKVCNESCRSCNIDGADKCSSCRNGQFLDIQTPTARTGPCANKTEANSTTIENMNILVRNSASFVTTETNPQIQMDLMSAMWQAYVNATQYSGLKVEILLESGSHYILPSNMAHFNHRASTEAHIDTSNPEFHLTIRPLRCNDLLVTGANSIQIINSAYCQPEDVPYKEMPFDKRIYLFNKVGGSFHVQIPLSLTWEGIHFDALDSILGPTQPSITKSTTDCFWTSNKQPYCPDIPGESAYADIKREQVCHYRSYESIFQFKNIDRAIVNSTDIQRLNISNSEFTNIFYELGSLVRTPEFNRSSEFSSDDIPWHLAMDNNVFANMSFCGSIISNDFPTFEGTEGSYIEEYNNGIKNEIRSKYAKSPTQNITVDCTTIECFKFSFTNNTVENLNQMKHDSESFFDQHVNWQMQKFGLMVHLTNFRGHVDVLGNVVKNIKLNFNDTCLYYENLSTKDGHSFDMMPRTPWLSIDNFYSPSMNQETQYLIPQQHNAHQLHSVIVLNNIYKDKNININQNVFEDAIVSNSLISVSQQTNNFPADGSITNTSNLSTGNITIQQNSFARSSSYVGTGVILVTKQDQNAVKSKTDANGYCGQGIDISFNNFTSIVGTCQTDTGLVRVQCNNTALANSMSAEYAFINQTRQIAPSEGQAGYFFNETSLEAIRPSFTSKSTIVRGNRVANCSLGVQQQVREGTRSVYVERVVPHTGTLFTFQELLRVEFKDNVIENIFPVNRLEFYVAHSPQYLNYGQTVIGLEGVQLQRPLENIDKCSSMLAAINVYELSMNLTTINKYESMQNYDSLLVYGLNGIKRLEIADSQFTNINSVKSPLINLIGQNYKQLGANVLTRQIIVSNVTMDTVLLGYGEVPQVKALLFDNFAGDLTINQFQVQNLSIKNVQTIIDATLKPQVQSIFKVVANQISIAGSNFSNIDLQTSSNRGSPVQLQLYNFTATTDPPPEIKFENNTFQHMKYTFSNKSDSKVSGLFSVYHDILQYDLTFTNNVFDDIAVETSDLTPIEQLIDTATILQTIQLQSAGGVKVPSTMKITFKGARFDNVFVPLHANLLEHQMFMFSDPISQMIIDDVEFTNFEHQFVPHQEGHSHPQTIQTFDPSFGPKVLIIQNSEIKTDKIHNITELRANLTESWIAYEEQVANGTVVPITDGQNRSVFTFRNFDEAKYVMINNLSISNVDFRDHDSGGAPTPPGKGSILRSYNSNINMNDIKATNITSTSNASVIYVEQSDHDHGDTFLSISNSKFESCSALTGGVIYSHRAASIFFYGSEFINNFANESAVLYASSFNSSNVQVVSSRAHVNSAFRGNSFGQFSDFTEGKFIIRQSNITSNQVINGSSTITLLDSNAKLSDVRFTDNYSTRGTHVLSIMQQKAKNVGVELDSTTFDATSYFFDEMQNVNGSYISIQKPTPVPDSTTSLVSTNSQFRMGSAKFGGAIYARDVQSFNLTLNQNRFEANRADVSGGAIFIDGLDSYNVEIKDSYFEENRCRFYGDNIFAQQTKRELKNPPVQGRRLQELSDFSVPRIVLLSGSKFTTSNSYTQTYFSNIETLKVQNAVFNKMIDSLVIEGGSMYLTNVFNTTITGSTFQDQKSLIRGGAIYMKQINLTYFGEPLTYSTYRLGGNNFQNCSSQQGGAIFDHMVNNLQLENDNVFQGNIAIRYNSEFQVPTTLQEAQTKTYERLVTPSVMGRGPAMFFDCHPNVRNCTLNIAEGTTFEGSRIFNTENNTFIYDSGDEFTDIKPLFYTDMVPIFPAAIEYLVEQRFLLIHFGTDAVFMTNDTEIADYDTLAKSKISDMLNLRYVVQNFSHVLNETQFNSVFNLSDIQSGNTTIFGQRMYIINDKKEIQTYDNSSVVTISVANLSASVVLPKLSYLKNGEKVEETSISVTAQNTGYFDVPVLTVYGLPGTHMELKIEFNFNQSEIAPVLKNVSYQFQPTNCAEGQIINGQGICQECSGPDLYLMEKPSQLVDGVIQIQECAVCEKEIFSCYGGSNVKSNKGYQLINPGTATFLKCDPHLGQAICLANNTCARGYEGVTCNQCSPFFYREFDGSCQECSGTVNQDGSVTYTDSSFTIFTIIFSWILIFCILYIVQKLVLAGQDQNKLSSGFYLFKNMVNYVIYFVLLSELYGSLWMNSSLASNSLLRGYIGVLRTMYRLPMNSVEFQCYQDSALNPTIMLGLQAEQEIYLNETSLDPVISTSSGRRITSTIIMASFLTCFLLFKLIFRGAPVEEKKSPPIVPSIQVSAVANYHNNGLPLHSPTPLSNAEGIDDHEHASFQLGSPKDNHHSNRTYGTTQQILPPIAEFEGGKEDNIMEIQSGSYVDSQDDQSQKDDSAVNLNVLDISTPRRNNKSPLREKKHQDDLRKAALTPVNDRDNTPHFNRQEGRPENFTPINNAFQSIPAVNKGRMVSIDSKSNSNLPFIDRQGLGIQKQMDSLQSSIVQDKSDLRSVLSENHLKRMQRYKFNPLAIFLILLSFMSLIQVIEQMILSLSCQPLIVANQAALAKPEWSEPLALWSFNFFDSSMKCDTQNGSFSSYELYAALIFIIVWLFVVPQFLLFKAGREFIIDYVSMTTKFALLVVIKYVLQFAEFYALVVGSFILVVQFMIFLVFRGGQVVGESQKMLKLKELNWIDFWMYMTLIITAFLGLCLSLLQKDLNEDMMHMIFIMIFAINIMYILFWTFKTGKFMLKHMAMSEKFVGIHSYLTCSCLKDTPDQTTETKLKKIQEAVDDEEDREKELQKIDMLIQHLNDVQRNIINNEMPARSGMQSDMMSDRSKYVNDRQLMQDIQDIIGNKESADLDDNRSYMDSMNLSYSYRAPRNMNNLAMSQLGEVNNMLARRKKSVKPKSHFIKRSLMAGEEDPEAIEQELQVQMAEYDEHMRAFSNQSARPPLYRNAPTKDNTNPSNPSTENQRIQFILDSHNAPSDSRMISIPHSQPMGSITPAPQSTIPVSSENMPLKFIMKVEEEDEKGQTQMRNDHGGLETEYFNDTFNKTNAMELQEPKFANNDIGNIMKALASIRYDNALINDKNILSSQENDSANISPDKTNLLQETNQSLKHLLQEVKDTNPQVHDEMKSMLPLKTNVSEIDNVMSMLSNLQKGLSTHFQKGELEQAIQQDHDQKIQETLEEEALNSKRENIRGSRSVFKGMPRQSNPTNEVNDSRMSDQTMQLPTQQNRNNLSQQQFNLNNDTTNTYVSNNQLLQPSSSNYKSGSLKQNSQHTLNHNSQPNFLGAQNGINFYEDLEQNAHPTNNSKPTEELIGQRVMSPDENIEEIDKKKALKDKRRQIKELQKMRKLLQQQTSKKKSNQEEVKKEDRQ